MQLPSTRVFAKAWQVGALCQAIAESLETRFNPVVVVGEVVGFVRASSGHCYFSLKDASGQLRCAMFRRAAGFLDFSPKDGELVEVQARLGVYEPRGELQLVVEHMTKAGQGTLLDQFMQIKAKLQGEGLFDANRKRPVPSMPRSIGVVTSSAAAAWHDTMTTLRRRAPHVPVLLASASVQGLNAPLELVAALESLYRWARNGAPLDVILIVRGGGAMEDLWAFNDERLARTMANSPVPLISGVGHETDFTICDFVADVRAPTPTAAAELAAPPTEALQALTATIGQRVAQAAQRWADRQAQLLDLLGGQVSKPSVLLSRQATHLAAYAPRLRHAIGRTMQAHHNRLQWQIHNTPQRFAANLLHQRAQQQHLVSRLQVLNPQNVLARGFAWLAHADGRTVSQAARLVHGDQLTATLMDGTVDVQVVNSRTN